MVIRQCSVQVVHVYLLCCPPPFKLIGAFSEWMLADTWLLQVLFTFAKKTARLKTYFMSRFSKVTTSLIPTSLARRKPKHRLSHFLLIIAPLSLQRCSESPEPHLPVLAWETARFEHLPSVYLVSERKAPLLLDMKGNRIWQARLNPGYSES